MTYEDMICYALAENKAIENDGFKEKAYCNSMIQPDEMTIRFLNQIKPKYVRKKVQIISDIVIDRGKP